MSNPIEAAGLRAQRVPPAPSRRWTVGRTWWELTKLVLAGRGGYRLVLCVEALPEAAQDAFDLDDWEPVRLVCDGCDRFALLTGDPG
jgi:hypothetical protein